MYYKNVINCLWDVFREEVGREISRHSYFFFFSFLNSSPSVSLIFSISKVCLKATRFPNHSS